MVVWYSDGMSKLKLYLETTIFNYYFDEDRDGHDATVSLFEEIKANFSVFRGYYSFEFGTAVLTRP